MRTLSRLISLSVALAWRLGLFPNVAFEGTTPRRIGCETERVRRMQDPEELTMQMQSDRKACLKAMQMTRRTRRHSTQSLDHLQATVERKALLLDLLPDFLVFSARTAALLDQKVSRQWMDLAASFMFQAALEQYNTNDLSSLGKLDEAFAWGWRNERPLNQERHMVEASDTETAAAHDLIEVSDMFCSLDGDAQIEAWDAVRLEYKARFLSIKHKTWDEHMNELASEFPVSGFEETLLEYLNSLFAQTQKQPLLSQLEKGRLEGMTKDQTADLMQRAFAKG